MNLPNYSVKAGAAHIAFTAPSRTAVRDFYAAALNAGGRPNGAPAARSDEDGHFNAAVLDFDGNSIEVVFRNGPDVRDDGTVIEHSRVITWQRTVAESYRDDRSVASARTSQSASREAVIPAASKAPSVVSKAPTTASKAVSMARSVSEPVAVPQVAQVSETGDGAAKKIIGTLLGAAAGAAVAYAMVKSEQDSAKKEADFNAFQQAKAAVTQLAQTKEQPKLSMQDPQQIFETQPKALHRNISDTDSQYSTPQARSVYAQRAIEPAPQSYHSPSYTSVPPTQVNVPRAIEYAPAYSVAPSRSHFAPHRSMTNPELVTAEKARSTMSKVHSVAPSTLISSFVPDQIPRRSSEGSVASHHSSKSKAKSSHTRASKHTSHTKHSGSRSGSRSRAPSPSPSKATSKAPTKAASLVGSILGRDSKSNVSKRDDFIDALEIEEINDTDTVAPSDSISNAGSSSRRSHRSRRSSKKDSDSDVSKHSSSSRHSKSSKHSHSSRKSHSSRSRHSEYHSADERPRLPTIISEPSDASTVKPAKSKASVSRKDSVTQGQYDGFFNGPGVSYGAGTVASLPVRGITPSMVNGGGESKSKSVISYAMGQKLRAFEG